MSLVRRIANLFSRSKVGRDIDDELRSHLEMRMEDNIAAGMSEEEARRDALLRFGNPVVMKERVAGVDAALGIDSVWTDVRFGFRQLRRTPGFAWTSIVILALGIGASTAIFSVVKPILLDPLPYPNAKRIMMIWEKRGASGAMDVTFASFHGMTEWSRSFRCGGGDEAVAADAGHSGSAGRFEGQRVSADFFRTLEAWPRCWAGILPPPTTGFMA